MILGVGLVSLATLFPIGLLRLRDATRYTRTQVPGRVGGCRRARPGRSSARQSFVADRTRHNQLRRFYINGCDVLVVRHPDPNGGQHSARSPGHAWPTAQDYLVNANARRSTRWRQLGHLGRLRAAVRLRPALAVPDRAARRTGLERTITSATPSRPGSARGSASSATDPDGGAAERPRLAAAHQFQPAVRDQRRRPCRSCRSRIVPSIFVSQEDVVWVEAAATSNCVQPASCPT